MAESDVISRSFGFSVCGTKKEALAALEHISVDGRPKHAGKILDLTRQIINETADSTTVSITVNTHIEAEKPDAQKVKE